MQSPLSINHLSKQFGTKQVLKDVSLSVQPGEIFGLIGLNGEGKTTMIKIILDLLNADKGEVSFFGEPAKKPASRKHIAYLPEKFTPSHLLKGMEFLSISLSSIGKPLDEKEAETYAEKLGLDPKALGLRVNKYSKGMGQKLGLLSIFLSGAPLLILDEPMSGLDPRARIQLKDQLLQYRASGKSVFFSSHILSDIDEICNRIAILHQGDIIFTGTPAEFKQQSKSENLERAFLEAIG